MNLPIDCVDLGDGFFLYNDGKIRVTKAVMAFLGSSFAQPVYTVSRGYAGSAPGRQNSFHEAVRAYDAFNWFNSLADDLYGAGSQLSGMLKACSRPSKPKEGQ